MARRRVNRAAGISRLSWCDRPVRRMTADPQCTQAPPGTGDVPARHDRACAAGGGGSSPGSAPEVPDGTRRARGAPGPAPQGPPDELWGLLQGHVVPPVPGPPLSALLGRVARVRRRRHYLTIAGALITGIAAASGWQALHQLGPGPRIAARRRRLRSRSGSSAALGCSPCSRGGDCHDQGCIYDQA